MIKQTDKSKMKKKRKKIADPALIVSMNNLFLNMLCLDRRSVMFGHFTSLAPQTGEREDAGNRK